jgi:hypothetical protein
MSDNGKSIDHTDFLNDVFYILKETFEGSPEGQGSAYLDQRVGVFSTLDALTAEEVSREHSSTSIVAHTEHLKFYLDRLVEFIEGREDPVNWDQSWLIDEVDEEEWDTLRAGMRNSYENVLRCLAGVDHWSRVKIGEAIAIIAHTAYHLGAIRQMAKR